MKSLREQLADEIVASKKSVAKVSRAADMNYATLLYLLRGANSRMSIYVAAANALGCDVILVKRK